ncbi:SOS response-associated peptidase [Halomicroarcula sp. S1AR25-4]|uniref:SOS response-associated peptidase n=1 Tax=Haloarcula sp. S1AR25-4 TaxID=2950538 RepID=UPI0028768B46|nr:SOS response-associated peptidase [Halomicroarcula sp. S1AR25-4]MDS0278195.1 SOS response-associated peptidase [Halomicroarcula sp. S1AR25-4]
MCGRYSLFAPPADLEARFDAAFDFEFEPRYNAAPSQSLPVVTNDDPDTIQRMEWGLIPSWADARADHGYINARAETLGQKRSFADAYESRRCLVPADGFYEWVDRAEHRSANSRAATPRDSGGGGKQPYRVALPDDDIFAMAGLYERWEPPQRQTGLGEFGGGGDDGGEDDVVETFTIVTTEPNDAVRDLHHRMAVILSPGEEETWLTADTATAVDLLDPYDGPMHTYPVSTAVNSPSNDRPELIEEVEV